MIVSHRLTGAAYSSLNATGTGLWLELGISPSHPESPPIMQPVDWTYRNLDIYLEPGGPIGNAPPCP